MSSVSIALLNDWIKLKMKLSILFCLPREQFLAVEKVKEMHTEILLTGLLIQHNILNKLK